MRNISFSMSTEAVRNRTKTVTRRLGWWDLKPGDLLQAVEKCQGLKKGEHVKKLAVIRVVSVTAEPLSALLPCHEGDRYGETELTREGFPELDPFEFVDMFISHNHCNLDTIVNRIEFEYVEGEA